MSDFGFDDPTLLVVSEPGYFPDITETVSDLVKTKIIGDGGLIETAIQLANDASAAINSVSISITPPDITVPDIAISINTDFTTPAPPTQGPVPAMPSVSGFDYAEQMYVSNLLAELENLLIQSFSIPSTGMTAALEAAMYARETNRDNAITQLSSTTLTNTLTGMGIDDIMANNVAALNLRFINARTDKARLTIETTEKLSIEFSKYMIGQAGEVEGMLLDYASKREDRKLRVAIGIVDAAVSAIDVVAKYYSMIASNGSALATIYSATIGAQESEARAQSKIKSAALNAQAKIAEIKGQVAKILASITEKQDNAIDEVLTKITHAAINLATGSMSGAHASADISYSEQRTESTEAGEAKVGFKKS